MFEMPLAAAIILSVLLAAGLTVFQYPLRKEKWTWALPAFLRFLSWLFLLLLLFNPKLRQVGQKIIKPLMVVLADNSFSINHLNATDDALDALAALKNNRDINERFEVKIYSFGNEVTLDDSLKFNAPYSDFNQAFGLIKQLYKDKNYPLLLLSDGRQTYGNDYIYTFDNSTHAQVFPIVLGDTVRQADLSIQRVNVNKSVFLDNEFPVEVFLGYEGSQTVKTRFTVRDGNRLLHSENLNFDGQNRSVVTRMNLKANPLGLKTLSLELEPFENEKNTSNNVRKTTLQVLDQQARILLIAAYPHPDIGAWKRAIESSPFRKVEVVSPDSSVDIQPYQLIIRFQPNSAFENIDRKIAQLAKNTLTIIGTQTDLNYINQTTDAFSISDAGFTENIQATYQPGFAPFYVEDIGFDAFPPLKGYFAEYAFQNSIDVLLQQRINNVPLNKPLFFTYEKAENRYGVFTAENIWQWRAASVLNENQSEKPFDGVISSVVMYLSNRQNTERLTLDYEPFQENLTDRVIIARLFDRTRQPDLRGELSIRLVENKTQNTTLLNMPRKGNYYQADVSRLAPGNYRFTVTENKENLSKSGEIIIPDYNPETQFASADVQKLQTLATKTQGSLYLPAQTEELFQNLLENPKYKPVLKAEITEEPLIQRKWLVVFIILTAGAEWIVRKYKGLL